MKRLLIPLYITIGILIGYGITKVPSDLLCFNSPKEVVKVVEVEKVVVKEVPVEPKKAVVPAKKSSKVSDEQKLAKDLKYYQNCKVLNDLRNSAPKRALTQYEQHLKNRLIFWYIQNC